MQDMLASTVTIRFSIKTLTACVSADRRMVVETKDK